MHLTFSERLRMLMEQRSLNYTAVARGTGVSRQTVYNWLETDRIKKNNLVALAEFLEVSPEWLQYGAGAYVADPDSMGEDPWKTVRQEYIDKVVRNEQRLNLAIKASNIIIWEYDLVSGQIEWSDNKGDVFNQSTNTSSYSLEDYLKKVAPDQRRDYEQRLTEVMASGGTDHCELQFVPASGKERWFDAWFAQRVSSGQIPTGLVGCLQEITQRKQAEQELLKNKQRLELALNASGLGIYDHCIPIGPELYHSEQWAKILGYTLDELPSYDRFLPWFAEQVHPEDVAMLDRAYNQFIEGVEPKYHVELRIRHKAGLWLYVEGRANAVARNYRGEVTHLIGSMLDITERKQTEAALRLSEQKFHNLFQHANDSIFIADAKSRQFIEVNENAAKRLGYTKNELLQLRIDDIGHPEAKARHPEIFTRIDNGDALIFETMQLRKDGSTMFVEVSARLIEMDGQNVIESIVRDISKRKQAEAALRSSEQRYRNLFENTPISVWEEDFSAVKVYLDKLRAKGITDLREYLIQHPETSSECANLVKIIDINQATLSMHGASSKKELLENLVNIFTPESFEAFNRELNAIWNNEYHLTFPAVVKTLAGQTRYVTIEWLVTPEYQDTLSGVMVSQLPRSPDLNG